MWSGVWSEVCGVVYGVRCVMTVVPVMSTGHRAGGRSTGVHGHHPVLARLRLQCASSKGGWSTPGGISLTGLPTPPSPSSSSVPAV